MSDRSSYSACEQLASAYARVKEVPNESATMSSKSTAVKRILADVRELEQHPSPRYHAEPLENNMFEWHFTIRGSKGSDFEGGSYHGRILLPNEYPFKPPNIIFLTKNGRFEVGTKICLSISAHHEESWQPAWGVRTMLEAIISFLPSEGAGAIGALNWSRAERLSLAKESHNFVCPICGPTAALLKEDDENDAPDSDIVAQISQLNMTSSLSPPTTPGNNNNKQQDDNDDNNNSKANSDKNEITNGKKMEESAKRDLKPFPPLEDFSETSIRNGNIEDKEVTTARITAAESPIIRSPLNSNIQDTPPSIKAIRRRILGSRSNPDLAQTGVQEASSVPRPAPAPVPQQPIGAQNNRRAIAAQESDPVDDFLLYLLVTILLFMLFFFAKSFIK